MDTPNSNPQHLIDETAELVEFNTKGEPDIDLLEKNITVGYNAALARLTSIAAASLYNRLCQWTRFKGSLENGWIYYTAKDFAFDTNMSPNTFTKAYRELVEAGLIEQKTTYIRMSRIKACHFRITSKSPIDLYKERKNDEMTNRKFANPIARKNAIPIYTEENTIGTSDFTTSSEISSLPQSTTVGASQPTAARTSTPSQTTPFGEEVKRRSVRPSQKDDGGRKRAYAVANNVRKRLGLGGQSTPPYKQLIGRWLECGFTEDDIVEANHMQMNANDGFHETLSPMARLSADSMDWYREQKNKDKRVISLTEEELQKYSGINYEVDEKGYPILPREMIENGE